MYQLSILLLGTILGAALVLLHSALKKRRPSAVPPTEKYPGPPSDPKLEEYEFRLKENQLLLQSILDNTNSLIYVKDLAGRYLIANRRFIDVLEQPAEAILGHTDYNFCTKEQGDHYKAIDDQVIATGDTIEIEEVLQTKNGPIHLLLTKFPLKDNDNNILGISGIATDITERVHYQQALISARVEAEDARKMQEQFLANMSHEIRTPMNGIQGMTNLLFETPLNPQQDEYVAIIRRSVENLLVIINDILDFSKIKAGKLTIEKIDFRLQDVVANVRGLLVHRMEKKQLRFETCIDPAIPDWLQGDPHRLNQILINLVGNAIKFSESGAIRLKVTVQEQRSNSVILAFSIADEGIGIQKEKLPFLFDSFSQAGLDISRKYGGTGLGLAICQQLLALQGGKISVTSREGLGTTFLFHIPYSCQPPVNHTRTTIPANWNFENFLYGLNFLVVEDNPVNQKVTDHVLKKAGAQVTIAENGEEAIHCLTSNRYDLIIMDLQMPVMDGYETTRHLRSHLQLQTPVLAMTANALNGERIRCLEAGMNDYMSKPFEFKDFYSRIAALLQKPGDISITPTIPEKGKDYNLSLLEEVGDEGYVQDILNTFLAVLPQQLTELSAAEETKDFDRIYFLAHKLKGSAGMIQATALTERLKAIEALSLEKSDSADIVREVVIIFDDILNQLKKEITQSDIV